ncbi:MAG: folate-binding protein [Pelagimonas sp.]|jgi:folate-binding protein YgfZ|nr:folate-binding protein [Pelagimonas sp.]
MARKVLRISGSDRVEFLQGLVTNDVSGLESGLVYAAMLTPQGKYLADFFLVPAGDEILLDVDADLAPVLIQRLSMYKLRADVQIADTDIIPARGLGDAPEGGFADPRTQALGWRAYDGRASQEGVDWDALHVAHQVPRSGAELGPDSYILEMGFERLNGVDFRKGCYVGQEVTARMKHKTELRKGLALVEIDGAAEPGTAIEKDGKPVGTLHSRAGDQALAYLRFDRAQGALSAGDAVVRMVSDT